MDFNRVEPTCYRTNFPDASFSKQNGAFLYIVLLVIRLTYTRGLIRFSNCAGLFRLRYEYNSVVFRLPNLIPWNFTKELKEKTLKWSVAYKAFINCPFITGSDKQKISALNCEYVFLPIIFSLWFGCSKEPSQ